MEVPVAGRELVAADEESPLLFLAPLGMPLIYIRRTALLSSGQLPMWHSFVPTEVLKVRTYRRSPVWLLALSDF